MTKSPRGSLFWAPRTLAILFVPFLSVFALDVFSNQASGVTRSSQEPPHIDAKITKIELKQLMSTAGGLLAMPFVPKEKGFGSYWMIWGESKGSQE